MSVRLTEVNGHPEVQLPGKKVGDPQLVIKKENFGVLERNVPCHVIKCIEILQKL